MYSEETLLSHHKTHSNKSKLTVDHPLDSLMLEIIFNGFKRFEGWIDKSHNGAENSCTDTKKDQHDKEKSTTQDQVFFGDLGSILFVVYF